MAVPISNTRLSEVQTEIQSNCYTSGFCNPINSLQEMFNATFNSHGFDSTYYDGTKDALNDFRNFSYVDRYAGTIDVTLAGSDTLGTKGGEYYLQVDVEYDTTTWKVIDASSFVTSYNTAEQSGDTSSFRIFVASGSTLENGGMIFSTGSHTDKFIIARIAEV